MVVHESADRGVHDFIAVRDHSGHGVIRSWRWPSARRERPPAAGVNVATVVFSARRRRRSRRPARRRRCSAGDAGRRLRCCTSSPLPLATAIVYLLETFRSPAKVDTWEASKSTACAPLAAIERVRAGRVDASRQTAADGEARRYGRPCVDDAPVRARYGEAAQERGWRRPPGRC